jgi:MerR family transcriptional regulator, heat shock protein HspR
MSKEPNIDKERESTEAVYVISVAAHLVGMHPQTLRLYEREGLIEPRRTPKKSRRYSERDIERLREIQRLTQEAGINLAGVRMVIEMRERLAHLEELVGEMEGRQADMEKEMEVEIERIRRSLSREVAIFRPGRLMSR